MMARELLPKPAEKSSQPPESRELSKPTEPSSRQLHSILKLQRSLGNQRVAALIQAKRLTPQGSILPPQAELTVGAADDPYDKQAGEVAQQVMSVPDSALGSSVPIEREDGRDPRIRPLSAGVTRASRPPEPAGGRFGADNDPSQQDLTTHELTHVVQQTGSPLRRNSSASNGTSDGPALLQREPSKPAKSHGQKTPPKLTMEQQIAKNKELSDKKITALASLGEFQEKVEKRADDWETAVLTAGIAYAQAASKHVDAIKEDEAEFTLESAVMMTFFTAFLGGAYGYIVAATAPGFTAEEDLLFAELKESTGIEGFQIGVDRIDVHKQRSERIRTNIANEKAVSSLPSKLYGEGGFDTEEVGRAFAETAPTTLGISSGSYPQPVSEDPFVFQSVRLARLSKAKSAAHDYLANAYKELGGKPDSWWDIYSEFGAKLMRDQWFSKADLLGTAAGLPSADQMAVALEKKFWAAWLKRVHPRNIALALTTEWPPIGPKLKERLNVLGIKQEAGAELASHWFNHGDPDDWQKLIGWAWKADPQVTEDSLKKRPRLE